MTVQRRKLVLFCHELIDCWTYSNPYTLDFVVGWLCESLSETRRIKQFQLNFTSFIMTSNFRFESSEDCIVLLDSLTKNLDIVLAFFLGE